MMRNRTQSRSGVLGGTDANQRLIYARKSMPRRKRRNWRRFVKKVNAVDERELGTRTVLFNNQIQATVGSGGSSDKQGCLTLALYSFGGNTTAPYLRDGRQIGGLENRGNPTSAAGDTVYPTTKLMFHSAILDLTIRNASVEGTGAAPPAAATVISGDLELDLYEITVNEPLNQFNGTSVTLWENLSQLLNGQDVPEIGGTGTGIAIQDRGASPWEFPTQLGPYRVRINKKTKFFIPSGRTITYQMRDPSRRVCQLQELDGDFSINKRGWTKFVFMVYKLVPGLFQTGNAVPPGPGIYDARIEVGNTRKYMYKVEGINEARERYISSSVATVNPC